MSRRSTQIDMKPLYDWVSREVTAQSRELKAQINKEMMEDLKALHEQVAGRVPDLRRLPTIDDRVREPLGQTEALIDPMEERDAAVGGQVDVIEGCGHGPTADGEEVDL